MSINIKWAGDNCQVGLWIVGGVFYDAWQPKGSPKYKAVCKLPGVVFSLEHRRNKTQEEAKKKVEHAVRDWFRIALRG